MNASTLSAIQSVFQAHGLAAEISGSEVRIQDDLVVEPFVRPVTITSGYMVELHIRVTSPVLGSTSLVESFAGIGNSVREAEGNAFAKFVTSSFHVLAESMTSHRCDSDQVDRLRWRSETVAWQVFSGPLLTQSFGARRLATAYAHYFAALEKLFVSSQRPGVHWTSVFISSMQNRLDACEITLDGQPWRDAHSLITATKWQCAERFESVRHLIIAIPESGLSVA